MQTFQNSTKGLGLLIDLSWDRLLFIAAIALALALSSQIGYLAIPAAY